MHFQSLVVPRYLSGSFCRGFRPSVRRPPNDFSRSIARVASRSRPAQVLAPQARRNKSHGQGTIRLWTCSCRNSLYGKRARISHMDKGLLRVQWSSDSARRLGSR